MRVTRPLIPIALLAAVLIAGCGSDDGHEASSTADAPSKATTSTTPPTAPPGAAVDTCASKTTDLERLRVAGIACEAGQAVAAAWVRSASCASAEDDSRSACTVRGYRCLGTNAGRGLTISCARPGRSISFIAPRS
jgi:hypothetical protein